MTITQLVDMARRMHDAERVNLGASSSREYRNAFWERVRVQIDRWQGQIRAAGGTADTIDMPAEGVRGNSHMIMMDTNSDDVARRIQRWMESRGLMRPPPPRGPRRDG